MTPQDIIDNYFAAMRRGPAGQADLVALFADDALYREPFVDPDTPVRGRDAIANRLATAWASPPPDMELDVLSVNVTGATAEVSWECRSPVFPQPVRGVDQYRFEDGQIAELHVTIEEATGDRAD